MAAMLTNRMIPLTSQLTSCLPARLTTYMIPIKPIDRKTDSQSRLLA